MEMKKTMGERLTALIAAGVIASAMLVPAAAFAVDTIEPSAGGQTGSGSTDVTVQTTVGDTEVGGNTDPNNPPQDPSDPDSPGSNIAFTVPSAINFVADSDGVLTGPDKSVAYIENLSGFGIHASSFGVIAEQDWTIVADGTANPGSNAADFQFGPAAGSLDADTYEVADATDKVAIATADPTKVAAWNMAAAATDYAETADAAMDASKTYYNLVEGDYVVTEDNAFVQGKTYYERQTSDRVEMATGGNLYNVSNDITSQTKIATIKTYVTAGAASVQP